MQSKLLVIFLLLSVQLFGQENSGSLHSNYMPTNSVMINPSSMLDAKTWIDIQIVGFGAYANNNLVALKNDNLARVIREREDFQGEEYFNQGKNKYHAYNRNFVQALGAVWSQGDHAAGLQVGVRSFTDVRGITKEMAEFIENGVQSFTIQHGIDYEVKKLRVNSIQFGEIRASYAYTFKKFQNKMFMGGISIHKHFSVGGAAANVQNFEFNVRDDIQTSVFNLQGDAMVTPDIALYTRGGMGVDLGFTYQKMIGAATTYYPNSPRLGCGRRPYKFKLGVSILDIGNIKFSEENTNYVGYDIDGFEWFNYSDIDVDETNANEFLVQAEDEPETGIVRNPSKIRLPTALSLQYDYNAYYDLIYLNVSWIQGMPISKKKFGIRRANFLSFTPRFETKFLEVAVPMSLYEYRYPQIGLAARIWLITIGTDKLGSFMGRSNTYGTDIYFHLKIPLTRHPKCRGKFAKGNSGLWRELKSRSHPCDAYN